MILFISQKIPEGAQLFVPLSFHVLVSFSRDLIIRKRSRRANVFAAVFRRMQMASRSTHNAPRQTPEPDHTNGRNQTQKQ